MQHKQKKKTGNIVNINGIMKTITIVSLDIYSTKLKTMFPQNLHTDVYSIFFIIAKTWRQLRCPSVDWKNNDISRNRILFNAKRK